MRNLRLLLIALVFLLHSAAGMASSVRTCCMDAHCPVADCVVMGCIADPLPPAAFGAAPLQHRVAPRRAAVLTAPPAWFESRVEDIWTPPD